MDLLTNSVNVPAERAKLRALRDEIAADVELRKEHQRKYTSRGFLRDMQPLATEGRPSHGETPVRALQPSAALGVPAAAADVRETQSGFCGCCGKAIGLGEQGVRNA